ncbi:Xaa-Pro dipeptidase [bacterium]|nr:MAG: Xaa-Pro dipeptidase [bacterium]
MKHQQLYEAHLKTVLADVERALGRSADAGQGFDGVIMHAGAEMLVHRDDQPHLFRQDFNFARLAPLPGPDHLAVLRPGSKPRLIRVVPEDYWYEEPAAPAVGVEGVFEYLEVGSVEEAVDAIGDVKGCAFVGEDLEVAGELGLDVAAVEPDTFMASLDFDRGFKTEWEAQCVREAAEMSARGHAAVSEGVAAGLSERELHHAYLGVANLVEVEVPYPTIIGWNEHAAVLHYQSKERQRPAPGRVLLIDAGASRHGYACDVTRTWATSDADPLFVQLLDGMEVLQRKLVEAVGPGVEFIDLHAATHEGIAALLIEAGILRGSVEEVLDKKLTLPFMPHGLGHHLGLQVHDVAGHQIDPAGTIKDPPARHPFLRTTRSLQEGHLVTIEPGLYFIGMLLGPVSEGEHASCVDWELVSRLFGCGGIRIEDNIHVTPGGREDLTRPLIPGHRG